MKKICLNLIFLSLMGTFSKAQEELPLFILNKHTAPVICVAWSPDGKFLATGSEDKTAIIWDAATGNPIVTLEGGHLRKVMALAFLPGSQKIVTAGDRTLVIWTIDGKKEKVLGTTTVDIWSISISTDGKYLAAASFDRKVQVFDLVNGTKLNTLEGHQKSALAVSFVSKTNRLLTGSLDETIKLWDVDSAKVLNTFAGHSGNIYSIASFSDADSDYFVSASLDKTIKLWNCSNSHSLKTYSGTQPVMTVSLAMGGKWMLSGSLDKTVTLRETATGNKIFSYIGFEGGISQVAFSPDGNFFAVASNENKSRIYKTNPDLFVDFYFENEVAKETEASLLFAPKGKDESRQDYKLRQDKAEELKKEIYSRYFKKYLEILAGERMEK